jgi:hypothetical protein
VRASCGNALGYANPSFLGDALRAPAWWKTTDIMSTLNQILAEKVGPWSVFKIRDSSLMLILLAVEEAHLYPATDQGQPDSPKSPNCGRGIGSQGHEKPSSWVWSPCLLLQQY